MKRVLVIVSFCTLCLVLAAVLPISLFNKSITITVDDLARMKTLAHEYLNERYRLVLSSDPDNNPNIAGAPVIDPSEMSSELATRQKVDVVKLKAKSPSSLGDDYATWLQVTDIRKEGDAVALLVNEGTCVHSIYMGEKFCSGEGIERYFRFARKGSVWLLLDAKPLYEGGCEVPVTEPSIEFREYDGPMVPGPPYTPPARVPEDIKEFDEEATRRIVDEWAVDKQTLIALSASVGGPHGYILGVIAELRKATSSDKPDAICFIRVKATESRTYPEALLAVTEETHIANQHNDLTNPDALEEGQTVEVDFTIYSQDPWNANVHPWNANARAIDICP